MRLGVSLPFRDLAGGSLAATSIAEAAGVVEDLGYRSIWTFDAVGRGFMLPDPLMALAVAATATEHVELGTGILQLPIRNVAEVAHRAFTLELLAPGRVLLGVGPGSTADDFDVFGGDHSGRFERFAVQWAELRDWVACGAHDGRDLAPWPSVRGGPALLLAGWRGHWVERAATESAGWVASAAYADDAQLRDALERFRAAGGERAVVTNVQVGEDPGPAMDRVARLGALGFDDVVVVDQRADVDRLHAILDQVG